MKVLLVTPPRDPKRIVHIVPPMGLGYLATSLLRAGIECAIIDCVQERIGTDELVRSVKSFWPDIIGFSFYSNNWAYVAKCAGLIRQVLPDTLIVAGGPHPSVLPGKTLQEIPELDLVFVGEAEDTLVELCRRAGQGFRRSYERDSGILEGIAGIALRRSNGEIEVRDCHFRKDIDAFGIPAWELIQPQKYPLAGHGVFPRNYPIAQVITSRGCPYPCTFCAGSTVAGKKVRYRSHDLVLEEILQLKQRYNIREIQIVDDNFTFRKEYAKELCQRIMRMNPGLTFGLPNGVRLDTLDGELLSLMKRAGFYSIVVGVESGSLRVLKLMKKKLEPELIREKIDLIKHHGLEAEGFFILGYPGETREDMMETIRFARSLKLDRAMFNNYVPLPGTESYKELINTGEIVKPDWNKVFVGGKAVYSPRGISLHELERIQRRAFLSFYLTPRRLIGFIGKLRPRNLKGILNRIIFTIKRA